MSWRDLPSSPNTLAFTADGTVDLDDVRRYGHFVAAPSSADITLTLDSPLEDIRGFNFFVTNDNGTYDVIVSCTDGFLQDGNSVTVQPGDTVWIHCNEDNDGDLRWLTVVPMAVESIQDAVGAMIDTGGTGTQTGITVTYQDATADVDFVVDAEWVQDLVGAMVDTGGTGTQTGITVTHQDSTDDIDFEVLYGTTADTACEGDDVRLPTAWADYVPTITWDTEPGSVTTVARYRQSGADTVDVKIYFTSADGDGRTPASITLPVITDKQVADIDALVAATALEYIDTVAAGGASVIAAWLDMEDGTPANRIIVLDGASAWTDTKDCWVSVSLSYEIEDSA
jgi:hypothetical protein